MFSTSLPSMVAMVAIIFSAVVPTSAPQMEAVNHVETGISYELLTDANGEPLTFTSKGGADL